MRYLMLAVSGFGLATGIAIIWEASLLARIIAHVVQGRAEAAQVGPAFVALALVMAARAILAGLSETTSLELAQRIQVSLRRRLLRQLFASGPERVGGERAADWVTAVVQGVDHLETFLARYVPQLAITALVPLIIGIKVLMTDWISAGILLLTVPLIPLFMALIGRRAQVETNQRWRDLARLGAHFLDLVQGLETLKLFGQSRSQSRALSDNAEAFRRSTMKSLRLAFMSSMVLELLASLSMAMIAVAIGLRLIGGQVSFQTAIFLLILIPDFYNPWRALGAKFHDSLTGLAAARQLFDWLDQPAWAAGQGTVQLASAGPWTLEVEHLAARYQPDLPWVLRDVTLSLAPGTALAVIGPTGHGKSTLLKVLMGFLPPSRGDVRVGGVALAQLDLRWWRRQISYIGQFPHLFAGTVRDNLLLAAPAATPQALWDAMQQARFTSVVERLPQGLDAPIGENGLRLSGGERQRLALARAFLQPTPVVLMDEPAAHLDHSTEQAIVDAIVALKSQSSVVVVTHRPATLRAVDRVVVIQDGSATEVSPREATRMAQALDPWIGGGLQQGGDDHVALV
jgi:thiol reductant ABC exporter CydD subunit